MCSINIEKNYLYKKEDFEFIPGLFEAIRHLKRVGYLIIIITNQSGIGRGYYSLSAYNELTAWLLVQFRQNNAIVDGVYFCPHSPDANCS